MVIKDSQNTESHKVFVKDRITPKAAELCVNEARFFGLSRDLLCIADLNGYFLHLNPAWTTKLGWSKDYLKSKPFLEFVHPEDCESTLSEVNSLAQGRETIRFENRYQHRDGSYRWLSWNSYVRIEEQRIYATARDVTHQKQLEREILTIADTERQRFGRELHDGVCQSLAGLAALCTTLSRQLASGSESEHADVAKEIATKLVETNHQTRHIGRELYSPGLNEKHLDHAVSAIA